MKKQSPMEIAVLVLCSLMFLTSSFDFVANLDFFGFSLRLVYLFLGIGLVLTLVKWIKDKRISVPEGFLFLGIWTLFILAFIPNTPLLIRNIGYGAWLLMNIGILFMMAAFITKDNLDSFLRFYLLSFFAQALLGIVQYITPQIGLPPIMVDQWWVGGILPRVHAFTYEPSYYATYLFLIIPFAVIFLGKGKNLGMPKWLFYTIVVTIMIAFTLSFSRISILLLAVFFAAYLAYVIFRQVKEKKFNLAMTLSFIVPVVTVAAIMLVMDIRLKQVKAGVNYDFYFKDTGLTGNNANSFKYRIQMMEKTLEVFKKNPVIGVSLGGIAPWIAKDKLTNITSNDQVKAFEGMNTLLEVLTASGVVGFIFFLLYIYSVSRHVFIRGPSSGRKDDYLALYFGFVLAFIMLLENQNILRAYVWMHLGLISAVIGIMRAELKAENPAAVKK